MTVLVTGSAGHLGEATIRTLRARGSPARGINLKPLPYTDATGSIVDPTFKTDGGKSVRAVLS